MKHDSDKLFFEYLVKNILQYFNIIDKDLRKHEKPDFINDNIGLEITRADESIKFQGFILKYQKKGISNIRKFNRNFERYGGKVLNNTNPIVKLLGLKDYYNFSKDYTYINPVYHDNFDVVNKSIECKLYKLNSGYDIIKHVYLGIFTTIYVCEDSIKDELVKILEIQAKYDKNFEKIIIVFLDKIIEFDFVKNTYKIINNIKKKLNDISLKTTEEIKEE